MALARRLGIVGILSFSWVLAVACGSEDSKKHVAAPDNGGGEGGEVTTPAGTAGSSNATAGSSNGGAAGETTTEGEAGLGGAAASAGNGSAGTPMGAAGEGGAPPQPAPHAKQCLYECKVNADCAVDLGEGQIDISHVCNPKTKRCEDSTAVCSKHADCIAFGNMLAPCGPDSTCDQGQACVTLDTKAVCAFVRDVETGCSQLGGSEMVLPRSGSAGNATVCLSTLARCDAGTCIFSCADALLGGCDPDIGRGDTCNEATGKCECADKMECTAGGVSTCGANSQCQCQNSGDCSESNFPGWTTCYEGTCGCGSADDCPAGDYVNAKPVCE